MSHPTLLSLYPEKLWICIRCEADHCGYDEIRQQNKGSR
jgi:hypothetical protein